MGSLAGHLPLVFLEIGASPMLEILVGASCLNPLDTVSAVALTYAPESTKASIVRLFSKYIGTYSISFFRLRTVLEKWRRYLSCSVFFRHIVFSNMRGCFFERSLFVLDSNHLLFDIFFLGFQFCILGVVDE